MVSDPYKVLGITKDATEEDIKKAYRKKAKECHPDLHPDDPNAQQKMNEINEAYDMLKNPEKYRTQQTTYSYNGQQNYNYYDFFEGYQQTNTDRIPMPRVEISDSMEIRRAVECIRNREYQSAYYVLMNIDRYDWNARWNYLCSLAFCGLSDLNHALEFIQKAVQMDPSNPEYMNVYNVLRKKAMSYRNPFTYQRTVYHRRHSILYYFFVIQIIMWILSSLFGGNAQYTRENYASPSQQYESERNEWNYN